MRLPGRHHDQVLPARIAAGDEAAWAELERRYRRPLRRYAQRLLRPGAADADDVVQDALAKAYGQLRDGQRPDDLSAWLHRICRNTAIDAVRSAQVRDSAPLEEQLLADRHEDPEAVIARREHLRRTVQDIAALPDAQRAALLARSVDGRPAREVAEELGVSPSALSMLVARARENLIRAQAAREADCVDVRDLLHQATERRARPCEHARRHLAGCSACRDLHRDLRQLDRRLSALTPPALPLLALLAGKLSGVGVKGAAGVAVLSAAGGLTVIARGEHRSGDRAPFALRGVTALTGEEVHRGQKIPERTALLSAKVHIPAGPPVGARVVTITCPPAMKVAGIQAPEQRLELSWGLRADTTLGVSRRARVHFARTALPAARTVTVAVLCRRPDRDGSLQHAPRRARAGERAARMCARQSYVYRHPGRIFLGSAHRGQPVSVVRASSTGRFTQIVTDAGLRGWVRTSHLCS